MRYIIERRRITNISKSFGLLLANFSTSFQEGVLETQKLLNKIIITENINDSKKKINDIQNILSNENIENARKLSELNQQYFTLSENVKVLETYTERLQNLMELYELAKSENDKNVLEDCTLDIHNLQSNLEDYQLKRMMASSEDNANCFLEIVAGVGGADAFDWAKMLSTMYYDWALYMNYRVRYIDEQKEDTAFVADGYRKVTLKLEGTEAYGWMKAEAGVHRLVRKSPFDPQGKRHTSFAQVRVYPVVENDGEDNRINTA
jgi:peptide chain release factor 2